MRKCRAAAAISPKVGLNSVVLSHAMVCAEYGTGTLTSYLCFQKSGFPLSAAFCFADGNGDGNDDVPASPIEVSRKPGLGQVSSLTKWTSG